MHELKCFGFVYNITVVEDQQSAASEQSLPSSVSESHYDDHVDDIGIHQPAQPRLKQYPQNNKGRRFRPEWYRDRSWLEHSETRDDAFCFPCRIFRPSEHMELKQHSH